MPNVRKDYARFQFAEFTYWEHMLSLIPLDDKKLRKEVASMAETSPMFSIYDQPEPEGEFTVKNRNGKKSN